jgi:hypothetical protein
MDVECESDHPYDDDGWFGGALIAEPISSPEDRDLRFDAPVDDLRLHADDVDSDDTDQWYMPPVTEETVADEPVPVHGVHDPQRDVVPWTGVLAPHNGRTVATSAAHTESWESKLSSSGAWDFKVSAAVSWYRSKRLVIASVTVAVTASVAAIVVMTGFPMSLRSPGREESVSPAKPTTAQPKPAEPAPTLSGSTAPPPPELPVPPPPLPPAADESTGPVTAPPYHPPRRSAPSQSDMPEIGVTRTPVTRAPLSATPPPPRAPDRNSSTPGDAPKRGWGRW